MTTRLLVSLCAAALSFHAFAQELLTLKDEEGNIVNGTVVQHPMAYPNSTDTVSLVTEIIGDQAKDIKVRRYEMESVEGTENFFCWGICFLPAATGTHPTWETPFYENLEPGERYNGFHAYHNAHGINTTARYRFVWFDLTDPQGDSSWVDIEFGASVGLAENIALTSSLEVWPNPSAGNDLQLSYGLNKLLQGTEIVLYNVLGDRVRRQSISAVEGRAVLPAAGLSAGVYFANLEANGRALATRRVVITR
ncbi:MAG: T9SS type A sorting domain-containing protein [Flavobacteriales bacterium]|nr:T9SS type A sorting domain-containing protein [Flavobacteriales bacterium]